MDDQKVSQAALQLGIEAPSLARYTLTPQPRGGLVLGYAGLSPAQIQAGIEALARVLQGIETVKDTSMGALQFQVGNRTAPNGHR